MSEHYVDQAHTIIVDGPGGLQQWTGEQYNNYVDEMNRTGSQIIMQVVSTHPTADDAAAWLTSKGLEL